MEPRVGADDHEWDDLVGAAIRLHGESGLVIIPGAVLAPANSSGACATPAASTGSSAHGSCMTRLLRGSTVADVISVVQAV